MSDKARERHSALSRILRAIKPLRAPYLIGLIVFVITEATFYVSIPLSVRLMIDAAIAGDLSGLWRGVLTIVGIASVGGVSFVFFMYLFCVSVIRITGRQRSKTFERALNLSASYHESHHSGDTISRLANDIAAMKASYDWPMFGLLTTAVAGLGAAVSMIALDWRVSLVLIATTGAFAWLNRRFTESLKRMGTGIQEANGRLTEVMGNILGGFSVIKQFNLESRMGSDFGAHNADIRERSIRRTKRESALECYNAVIGWINFGGILAFGAVLAGSGAMTFGTIIAMTNLLWNVNRSIRELGAQIAQFQGYLAGTARVEELQDGKAEEAALSDSWSAEDDPGGPAIEMSGVSFSYDGRREALSDFSLTVAEGATVGIAGPSGGGKSTALKLLLGFYEPSAGTITVARSLLGKASGAANAAREVSRAVSREALRAMIAYVPQDPFMFSGTIAENIGYGREGAPREDIEKAARAAHAHDFISELEQGYDTVVGERGVKLSGGQRQRIAIARAFLRDSPVVLLDEATSSLDSRSELAIQQALAELGKRKTVIIVAHRLSTIRDANPIYVVDGGRVAERGSHGELMAAGGLYRSLHESAAALES